eukprot:TRINITY_DN3964_c0_g1_i2.p1 TRINITY_DN3964_c0_g1~~TRINITY_DN3964_c0_g1_i2.p1  ORF type:complete len:343 (-),score=90.52 TRINITY_DN3964_c0_g1_i2:38-1066(-)
MSVLMSNLMITDVKVGNIIGSGFFGSVYCGSWNGLDVAMKCISAEDDEIASQKWKEEIKLLHKLNHPNVVRLLGLYEHQQKVFMVMEFAEHGSVDSFLKKHTTLVRPQDMLKMTYEMARGMQYLAKVGVIHRDLSARNLLLDGLLHIKISDFGMSREDSVYKIKSRTLPFRWCAPEVLLKGINTSQSDVWSFAVTIFEIYSFGKFPFEHLTNEQVLEATTDQEGERLIQPASCPDKIWNIAQMCFRWDPQERPTFKDITNLIINAFPELESQVVVDDHVVAVNDDAIPLYTPITKIVTSNNSGSDQFEAEAVSKMSKSMSTAHTNYSSTLPPPSQQTKDELL